MIRRVGLRDVFHAGLGATVPRRWFCRRGPAGGRSVCLTFDDGPHPEHTPRLLDALRARGGVVATFFLVGREARRHRELVLRIVAEGHSVGNHTFSHPSLRELSRAAFRDEIRRTDAVLAEILGRPAPLFRPPHGRISPRRMAQLWREGRPVVLWNRDPKDHALSSADRLRDALRARPLREGDLVLLHDTYPHAASILPDLVSATRRLGLEFTTVDAWLRDATPPAVPAAIPRPGA